MECKRPSCHNPVRDNPYRGHQPEYCSKQCKNIEAVNMLRRRRKMEMVEMLGGMCVDCGYDKPIPAVYHFHHKDPSTKAFSISNGLTKINQEVLDELAKCELLCANCHAERHMVV